MPVFLHFDDQAFRVFGNYKLFGFEHFTVGFKAHFSLRYPPMLINCM